MKRRRERGKSDEVKQRQTGAAKSQNCPNKIRINEVKR